MKIKIKFYNILSFAILIMVFNSCCKDDPEPNPFTTPLYIPLTVKDYMYFKAGTYWVYKEENTGVEDSVYVYYAEQGLDTMDGTGGNPLKGIFEWFKVYARSTLDGYYYQYYVHMSWSTDNNTIKVWIYSNKSPGRNLFLVYPWKLNTMAYGFDYDTMMVEQYYSSGFTINTFNYPEVIKIHYFNNIIKKDEEVIIYYSKHYGIIQKNLVDSGKTYSLERFLIIQ